jgi:hypothetical protein
MRERTELAQYFRSGCDELFQKEPQLLAPYEGNKSHLPLRRKRRAFITAKKFFSNGPQESPYCELLLHRGDQFLNECSAITTITTSRNQVGGDHELPLDVDEAPSAKSARSSCVLFQKISVFRQ